MGKFKCVSCGKKIKNGIFINPDVNFCYGCAKEVLKIPPTIEIFINPNKDFIDDFGQTALLGLVILLGFILSPIWVPIFSICWLVGRLAEIFLED